MAHSTVHYQITNKKIDLLREPHLELFFDFMNAPITKEDFIRPIWFLGAKLFDGDIVHTS
ncbi:hypothetical protein OKW96_02075 [Sphingobacterium sp. KU25419]|nr:hypothetical protein OKW96_02075 [Sphingobacterium sp. KU25419]